VHLAQVRYCSSEYLPGRRTKWRFGLSSHRRCSSCYSIFTLTLCWGAAVHHTRPLAPAEVLTELRGAPTAQNQFIK